MAILLLIVAPDSVWAVRFVITATADNCPMILTLTPKFSRDTGRRHFRGTGPISICAQKSLLLAFKSYHTDPGKPTAFCILTLNEETSFDRNQAPKPTAFESSLHIWHLDSSINPLSNRDLRPRNHRTPSVLFSVLISGERIRIITRDVFVVFVLGAMHRSVRSDDRPIVRCHRNETDKRAEVVSSGQNFFSESLVTNKRVKLFYTVALTIPRIRPRK